MNLQQNKSSHRRGHTLVEAVVVIALIGAISAITIPIATTVESSARDVKLTQRVRTLNSAVVAYIGSGGNLDGLTDAADIIDRLKLSLSDEDRKGHIGFGGAAVDQRLSVRLVDEVAYSPKRVAVWNSAKKRFQISTNATAGSAIAEFTLDESAIPDISLTKADRRQSAFQFNRGDGWVWAYVDSEPAPALTPSVFATNIPETEPFVPSGPVVEVAGINTVSATLGTNLAINPGFEEDIEKGEADRIYGPSEGLNAYYIDQGEVFGWNTTASDGLIEIWESGFNGVDAYNGDRFVEFNATEVSTLYQKVNTEGARSVRIFFAHGQRVKSSEQLRLYVGLNEPIQKSDTQQLEDLEAQGFEMVLETNTDAVGGWRTYSAEYTITGNPANLYFAFQSIGEFQGKSFGNFLDDVSFQAVRDREVTGLQIDLTQGTSISNIIESGTVKLVGAKPGDRLSIEGLPDFLSYRVDVSTETEEITLAIEGDAFRWDYESAFSRVTFSTDSEDETPRTLFFSVDDGYAVSEPVPFEITF